MDINRKDILKVLDDLRLNHIQGSLYQEWVDKITVELQKSLSQELDDDVYRDIEYSIPSIAEDLISRLYE